MSEWEPTAQEFADDDWTRRLKTSVTHKNTVAGDVSSGQVGVQVDGGGCDCTAKCHRQQKNNIDPIVQSQVKDNRSFIFFNKRWIL